MYIIWRFFENILKILTHDIHSMIANLYSIAACILFRIFIANNGEFIVEEVSVSLRSIVRMKQNVITLIYQEFGLLSLAKLITDHHYIVPKKKKISNSR